MQIHTTTSRALPAREERIQPLHTGRRIIVTGAARGLGRSTAELLLAQGARVALLDVLEAELAETAAALGGADAGVLALCVDLSDREQIRQAVVTVIEAFGGVDALANVAGIVRHSDPLEISRDDWNAVISVNNLAPYELSRAVAQHLIAAGRGGSIVNVASEAGKVGHVDSLAYSASKAALINQTRVLSAALASADINVNCVCPGGLPTPMLREVADVYAERIGQQADDIFDAMIADQIGRHIEPREVARVISFLLTDDAFAIRGQAINVDGGVTPY